MLFLNVWMELSFSICAHFDCYSSYQFIMRW